MLTPYVKSNTFDKEETKNTKKNAKHSAKKTFITTKKTIILCVQWDKKCTKPTKAQKQHMPDTQSIYRTIRLVIAKDVCFWAFVLTQKEIVA